MAKKDRKGMVGLGCDIHEDIAELLDTLSDKQVKYKVVEAAILCFAALPKRARMYLIVQDEQSQKVILDHLRKLNLKDLE